MKSCKNCGAELSDKAIICTECGEVQSNSDNTSSDDGFFSMPYLSAAAPAVSNKSSKSNKNDSSTEDEKSSPASSKSVSKDDIINDKLTDPLERAFAKRDKRNKLIRIIAIVTACIIVISVGAYFIFRSKGYHRTLDNYIDGRTSSGGTKYLSIVPELYLINAESLYNMRRPDIKSNTGNYLQYVENQLQADYGNNLSLTYKITSERTVEDKNSLETIENTITSTYSTDINISEAAYVNIRLTTKGSVTQSSENMSLTFYKYDGDWYCLDAMEVIQFACENAGYNLW